MATILILDDDQGVRDYLCVLLSPQGHRVVQAAEADLALSLFQSECPHLVIVDIVMQQADGFDFIRQLRKMPNGVGIPVILHTTTLLNQETRALAQSHSVNRIVEKPCSSKMILDAVHEALGGNPEAVHSNVEAVHASGELGQNHLLILTEQLATKKQELQDEVSQRKQLEHTLRVTQRQLNDIIDSAMDAIITLDANETIVFFNVAAEDMFQFPSSQAIGRPLYEFIPERFRPVYSAHIRQFARTGSTSRRTGELRSVCGVRKDGTEFPMEASLSQVEIERRRFLTFILRDVTERQRVERELRETAERLRQVSRRVIEIQESERRHLARELHDEIGQVLSAVSVNLKIVKTKVHASVRPRLEESTQIVDKAIEQVRNLSLDLRPSVLDDFGLASALRWYVDRLSVRTGLRIHLTTEPHTSEIPFEVRNACFRVAQEALTNVVRHAAAREAWIELVQRQSEVLLTIRDDGQGFDVDAALRRASQGGSLGLLGMRERIELLDGKAHLQSQPRKGTTIQIRLPLATLTPASA